MVLIGCFFLWIIVLGCIFGTNDYGGAKHSIPKKFKYFFPFIGFFAKKGTILDIIGIIAWHLYFYCWILGWVIMNNNIKQYESTFFKILIFAYIVYLPYIIWVIFKHARWQDKKENNIL